MNNLLQPDILTQRFEQQMLGFLRHLIPCHVSKLLIEEILRSAISSAFFAF